MSEALYTHDILRLAVSIPHEGRLDNPQGTGERRSQTCGSRVICDVILSDTGTIEHAAIQVHACALGQASAAILMKQAVGKHPRDIETARDQLVSFLTGQNDSPGSWDQIDLLSNARFHSGRHAAIILPYDALIAATKHALAPNEAI